MPKSIERLEATAQIDRALMALGAALGLVQDASPIEDGHTFDAETISKALALCVKGLYRLKRLGLTAAESAPLASKAMDHLRSAFGLLHDVRKHSAMENAEATVARSLAILYPVARLVEQLHGIAPSEHTSNRETDSLPSRRSMRPGAWPAEHERRISPRYILEADIGIHSGANFFTGFTQDISAGGLFFSTFDVLPVGAKVNANFSLPDGSMFSLNGTVRWVREYNDNTPDIVPGMGIAFDALSEEEAAMINHYMTECPPLFYE